MSNKTNANIVAITNTPGQEGLAWPPLGGSVISLPIDNTAVYKKIYSVLKKGIAAGKSGWNNFHKYHYTTEADVVDVIQKAFAEHGLIYQFDMLEVTQVTPEIVRAKIRFSLIDPETGGRIDSVVYGDGQDKGDKGVFKAITGAQKYFLLKTFLLSTGDDPENDSAVPNEAKPKAATAPKTASVEPVKVTKPLTTQTSAPTVPGRTSFNRGAFNTKEATPAVAKQTVSEVKPESKEDAEY